MARLRVSPKCTVQTVFLMVLPVLILFAWARPVRSEELAVAPAQIQAALFVKLLAFHQGLAGQEITIHVVGNDKVAAELKRVSGVAVGTGKLGGVTAGGIPPEKKPSAVYIGDPARLEAATDYARKNGVITLTGLPELVPRGVSLGIGISGGKPRVLLNISASKDEGIRWDPTILKVSLTYQ